MSDLLDADLRFSIVPEWVLDAGLTDRAIRIYALISRYADNDTLQAFPSRETLAERAGCSVKSVDRAIRQLVEAGALKKSHRMNGDAYTSNLYTVKRIPPPGVRFLTTVGTPQSPGGDTGDARVGTPVTPGRATTVPLTRTSELEPIEQKPVNYIGDFDQFWNIYPKKADKALARRSFEKALKTTTLDVILAGAERYRDDPGRDPEFTKNPSTWLNAEAWDNDPLPVKSADIPTPGPGKREWVRAFHEDGDHWACEPGEFGCK
jgi:hypothetical protein